MGRSRIKVYFFFLGPFSSIFSGKADRAKWLCGRAPQPRAWGKWQMTHGLSGRVVCLWVGLGCQVPEHISYSLDTETVKQPFKLFHYKSGEIPNWEHSWRKGWKQGKKGLFCLVVKYVIITLRTRSSQIYSPHGKHKKKTVFGFFF